MNRRQMIRLIAGLVVFAALMPVMGADAPRYLDKSALDPVLLLPPPAAANSAETKAELETLLRIQQARTPAQAESVRAHAKLDMSSFHEAVGPWFTPENLPLTAALLKKVEKESKYYSEKAKDAFGRKRPRFEDAQIKPAIDGQDEASYPSGHATRGMLLAIIVAQLSPENEAAVMTRGWELGWARVIAGVHYPSDIVAGRVLGKALARAMMSNPAFRQDFEKARSEVAEVKKRLSK